MAVAILAILSAIAVWGYRHATAGVSTRATDVSMKALKSMVVEYELGSKLTDVEKLIYPSQTIAAPQSVAEGLNATDPAIVATRRILKRMSKVPAVQSMINDLPPEVKGTATADGPILLDGRKNPIIYVPANGMTGVSLIKNPDGTFQKSGKTITSASQRGFWAGAGDDANFAADGSDNEYSDTTVITPLP